jgi:hypothetical protein
VIDPDLLVAAVLPQEAVTTKRDLRNYILELPVDGTSVVSAFSSWTTARRMCSATFLPSKTATAFAKEPKWSLKKLGTRARKNSGLRT